MHNIVGDVAFTNISWEITFSHGFVQNPKQTFCDFPRPQYVLSMFLNFGHFSASCPYKKDSRYEKEYFIATMITNHNYSTMIPFKDLDKKLWSEAN